MHLATNCFTFEKFPPPPPLLHPTIHPNLQPLSRNPREHFNPRWVCACAYTKTKVRNNESEYLFFFSYVSLLFYWHISKIHFQICGAHLFSFSFLVCCLLGQSWPKKKVNLNKSRPWRPTWGSSAHTPVSEQLPAKLTPALFIMTILWHNPLPTWFVLDRHKTVLEWLLSPGFMHDLSVVLNQYLS